MDTIFSLLDDLEDMLEQSKSVPFSTTKVGVNKEDIFEITSDIRLNIPGEIKQAQRIADNCDKIINEANMKATSIIKDAEEKAERLTMEHEITKMAKEQAELISEEARDNARAMRIGAVEYTDELLANAERVIRETLDIFTKQANQIEDFLAREADILYENRKELRGGNE